MDFLPLDKLGAREKLPRVIEFGTFFPGIRPADGYSVAVKIIHERDQYLQNAPAGWVPLDHAPDEAYGDYWYGRVDLATAAAPRGATAWGQPGRYVYRYVVTSPTKGEIDFIVDPFAREFGVGHLSAITVGYKPYTFNGNELAWRVPALRDMIVYELMISEVAGSVEAARDMLPYLADLGVNCIEVMPVSNVANTINWGYDPSGYFGVDERFGRRSQFQEFVDRAHQLGIAVVVDVVYGHTSGDFPYAQLYGKLGSDVPNPFIGPFAEDEFVPSTDFGQRLCRDYFYSVNRFWLETFHVDGFRYDAVPDFYDGPAGKGFADLAYSTFQFVKSKAGAGDHFARFFDSAGVVRLVQIGEDLKHPADLLDRTFANSVWQNLTLDAARACARGEGGAIARLGLQLGLPDFTTAEAAAGDGVEKSALQYFENHDHERFICNFGTHFRDDNRQDDLLREGDRGERWFKVQPYLIGLLTAKGTPFLWEGLELLENYYVPDNGWGRVLLFRPVRWNYFYDDIGRAVIRLVRKLTKIRRGGPQFRGTEHYFCNDPWKYNNKGLLVFRRWNAERFSLVALNFTDEPQTSSYVFERAGDYREEIEGTQPLPGVMAGEERAFTVPSNYGCIWTTG
jgi:maltooligosyltrehalose trehalohydrolase